MLSCVAICSYYVSQWPSLETTGNEGVPPSGQDERRSQYWTADKHGSHVANKAVADGHRMAALTSTPHQARESGNRRQLPACSNSAVCVGQQSARPRRRVVLPACPARPCPLLPTPAPGQRPAHAAPTAAQQPLMLCGERFGSGGGEALGQGGPE